MKLSRLPLLSFLTAVLFSPVQASALTMSDFKAICASSTMACKDHPILRTYVGGALDVLAVLSEETKYLETIYCEKPSSLFDTEKIIPFMELRQEEFASKNAMLVLIKYLEEHGGC